MSSRVTKAITPQESRPDKVGPRITALRETLALSKGQFADSVGLDRSTLTKIEQGNEGLSLPKGIAVATLYGVGLDFIYRGDLSDVPEKMRPRLLVNLVTYKAM